MNLKIFLLAIALPIGLCLNAQKTKTLTLSSPDGSVTCTVSAGKELTWSVQMKQQTIIAPSAISMQLRGGEMLGKNMNIVSAKKSVVNNMMATVMYKKIRSLITIAN